LGLYKPKFGMVLTTKGVAPEVKTHFERVKPDAKILYVERMEDLDAAVAEVVGSIRSEWELDLLWQFDPLARVDLSPSEIIAKEIGLPLDAVKKKRSSRWNISNYMDDTAFTWLNNS